MLGGGMVPVRSLRTTFSQTSAPRTRVGDVGLVQHQARRLELLVVAGDAVAIEHLTVARRRWHRAGWGR